MQLNKLSFEYIANAFREETEDGRVFAVLGRQETIKALQRVFNGVPGLYDGATCFGATYILSDRVPEGSVVLGVLSSEPGKHPYLEDFKDALDYALCGVAIIERTVWGRLLPLT